MWPRRGQHLRCMHAPPAAPRLNAMKRGLPGGNLWIVTIGASQGGPVAMLYAGLDLSRHRLDVHLMNQAGEPVQITTAPPDADGLRGLARQVGGFGQPVVAAIESMNGARFVHDQLELAGWEVELADAQKVKGLAPLACKTDRIDAWSWPSCRAATWCPRSGCPPQRSVRSGNGPGSG